MMKFSLLVWKPGGRNSCRKMRHHNNWTGLKNLLLEQVKIETKSTTIKPTCNIVSRQTRQRRRLGRSLTRDAFRDLSLVAFARLASGHPGLILGNGDVHSRPSLSLMCLERLRRSMITQSFKLIRIHNVGEMAHQTVCR